MLLSLLLISQVRAPPQMMQLHSVLKVLSLHFEALFHPSCLFNVDLVSCYLLPLIAYSETKRVVIGVCYYRSGGTGVSPPLLSLRHSVTSPSLMLNSPLTANSPAVSANILSSPASVSSPWPQSSPGPNEEIKQVSLMEQIRRLKCGGMPQPNASTLPRSADGVTGTGTPASTPQSASSSIGLKDLLLSNDDDDISKSDGPPSRSNSRLSDTPSGSALNSRSFLFPTSDSSAESRKRHASSSERPDSSTKSAKPNVLLMKLLSGQDDDVDNETDSNNAVATNTVNSNANHSAASKPTSSVISPDAEDRRDGASSATRFVDGRKDSGSESTVPRNNNLLRVSICMFYFQTFSGCLL